MDRDFPAIAGEQNRMTVQSYSFAGGHDLLGRIGGRLTTLFVDDSED